VATFVHLAPESRIAVIRRNGIAATRGRPDVRGVFAMPVVPEFQVSHQWVRELRRFRTGPLAGVYFRLADDEMVLAGRYNQSKVAMTAAEAIAHLKKHSGDGFEVFIPRRIAAKEIFRVKALPQTVGWRFFPEAKGSKPFCCCPYCQKGRISGRKLIERWEKEDPWR
jgi:hypothetical protein